MMRYALPALLLCALPAHADLAPTHATMHLASVYSDKERYLDEANPGLGFRWLNERGNGPGLGAYRNGQGHYTTYAGYSWGWRITGPVVAGVMVGAYRADPRPGVHPFVVPSIGVQFGKVTPKLSLAIKDCAQCVTALHFSLDFDVR